ERNPRLLVPEIVDGNVRGVPAVRADERKCGIARDIRQQRIERHAFPHCVELRPSRHAMDISRDRLAWQLAKRLPAPSPQHIPTVIDRELPPFERNMRSRTGG